MYVILCAMHKHNFEQAYRTDFYVDVLQIAPTANEDEIIKTMKGALFILSSQAF